MTTDNKNRIHDRRILLIFCIPILLFTAFLLYRMTSNMLTGLAIPNEFREAVNIELTGSILRGENPYSEAMMESLPPGPCYLYPFGYCYFVALLARIFPADLKLLHYLVTLGSMLLSALVLSVMVKKQTKSVIAAVLAFPLMLMCHWRYGYIGAVPDSFGLLLFTLALYLASLDKRRGRVFVSALLTVALFYIKQYFILLAGVLGLYYLFLSKRDAVKYVLYCAVLTLGSAVLVTFWFPTYWTYAFYLLKGTEVYFSAEQFLYMLRQYAYVGTVFAFLLLPVLVRIAKRITSAMNEKRKTPVFQWKEWGQPLIRADMSPEKVLFWSCFFVCGAGLFYFGLNNGAYLTYYLQLWCPSVVFLGLTVWEEWAFSGRGPSGDGAVQEEFGDSAVQEMSGDGAAQGALRKKKKAPEAVLYGIYGIIAIATLFLGYRRLPFHILNEGDLKEWEQAYSYLDEYGGGEIYHSPTTAFYAFDNNQYVYDTGHVNITRESNYEIWKESEPDRKLFPYAGPIYAGHHILHEEMRDKALKGEYSLITYVDGLDIVFTPELLDQSYRLLDTLSLQTGNMEYDTQFWVPKG